MAEDGEKMTVKERAKVFESQQPNALTYEIKAKESRTNVPTKGNVAKKTTGKLFEETHEFISSDETTGKLRCNEDTVRLLTAIQQPLNVVAITGLFRTGKSYLLNKLFGQTGRFKTGNTIHACTKGIWIRCLNHPRQDGQVLVLLDVEGFGDIDKANREEDTWLFILATILSSTLVYNNKEGLDSYALDRLNFLEAIDSTIKVGNEEEDKLFDFGFFFPTFVLTLRDFGLEMVNKKGDAISPDEYFEDVLVQKRGTGADVQKFNKIRLLIRRYFQTRKCFAFIQPCGPNKKLEQLADKEIEPFFLKTFQEFSDYVLDRKPLQMKSGKAVNGRMFSNLAMHYTNGISQHEKPSILEAAKYMAQTENQATVQEACQIYKKEMQLYMSRLGDLVPKDDTLVDFHDKCMAKAIEYIRMHIVFDDEEIFKEQTISSCRALLSQFKRICDQNSVNLSREAITRLDNQKIQRKIQNGAYCCETGYDEYIEDVNWVVRRFTGLAGLGAKSKEVLQAYLDGKEKEEERVYQMVLKSQGKTDNDTSLPAKSRASVIDLAKTISRSENFRRSLAVKVDKVENDASQVIVEESIRGRKNIQECYLENLVVNIKELKRQLSETRENKEAQEKIERRIQYLNNLYKYIESGDMKHEFEIPGVVNERTENTSQDNMEREAANRRENKKGCIVQ